MAESIRQIGSGLVHFARQQPLIQEELFYSSDIWMWYGSIVEYDLIFYPGRTPVSLFVGETKHNRNRGQGALKLTRTNPEIPKKKT